MSCAAVPVAEAVDARTSFRWWTADAVADPLYPGDAHHRPPTKISHFRYATTVLIKDGGSHRRW